MSVLNSWLFLIGCMFATYGVVKFFEHMHFCYKNFHKKVIKRKDELLERRCNYLFNNIEDYYYTMAINNPCALAYELANFQLNNLIKQKKVNVMYTKVRAK